jgi:hypothetical protein
MYTYIYILSYYNPLPLLFLVDLPISHAANVCHFLYNSHSRPQHLLDH